MYTTETNFVAQPFEQSGALVDQQDEDTSCLRFARD